MGLVTGGTERLRITDGMENAATAYCHVFYENQIEDSWRTAREVELMIPKVVEMNPDDYKL